MIRAVVFDLDNTLYNEHLYFVEVFSEFCRQANLEFSLLSSYIDENIRIKSSDIFRHVLKSASFFNEERHEKLFLIYKNIECSISLYDDALDILGFLKTSKYKTGVLTNGVVEAQKNKIKCLGIGPDIIDTIFYARMLGKENEKPCVKAFDKISELLEVEKKEILFVGDHPFTDIKGAINSGMKAVRLLRGYAKEIPFEYDKVIYDLNEIKDYLI